MLGSKKMLTSLATLVILLVLSALNVFAVTGKGTITGETVNLRAKPDVSSKIVVQLEKGTVVDVTSQEGDWYKVSFNDATGWVSSQFVTVKESVIGSGTIKGTEVNVRSKPDTSAEIITKLDNGDKVSIIRKSGDWYRVSLNENRYGWINSDYVLFRESTSSRGVKDDTAAAVSAAEVADEQGSTVDEDSNAAAEESKLRQEVVAYAKKFLGVKYVYGGESPKGFDCSGFVQYVFKNFDIKLDRSSEDQALNGKKIKKSELKPGDTVYFDTNGGHNAIEHAGIYIGNGKFIHASSGRSNRRVVISSLTEGYYNECYMWARRVITD